MIFIHQFLTMARILIAWEAFISPQYLKDTSDSRGKPGKFFWFCYARYVLDWVFSLFPLPAPSLENATDYASGGTDWACFVHLSILIPQ